MRKINTEVKCKVACVSGGKLPTKTTIATVSLLSDDNGVCIHCQRKMYGGQTLFLDLDPILAALRDHEDHSGGYTHV